MKSVSWNLLIILLLAEWGIVSKTVFSIKKVIRWHLFFRGVANNGVDVYEALKDGVGATTTLSETCKQNIKLSSCQSHYRNNTIVDLWDKVKQVKFSIFRNDIEKQFITFDADATDHLQWFSKNRVLESSWCHLRYQEFRSFSIEGVASKHFYILSDNTRHGCDNDAGYFVAYSAKNGTCKNDTFSSFPTFRFSKLATSAKFNSYYFSDAHYISIFVEFQK